MKTNFKKYLSFLVAFFLTGCVGKGTADKYRKIELDEAVSIAQRIKTGNSSSYTSYLPEYYFKMEQNEVITQDDNIVDQIVDYFIASCSIEKQFFSFTFGTQYSDHMYEESTYVFVQDNYIHYINMESRDGQTIVDSLECYRSEFDPNSESDLKEVDLILRLYAQAGLNCGSEFETRYMGADIYLCDDFISAIQYIKPIYDNGGFYQINSYDSLTMTAFDTEAYTKNPGDLKVKYEYAYDMEQQAHDSFAASNGSADVKIEFEIEDTLVLSQTQDMNATVYSDGHTQTDTTHIEGTMVKEAGIFEINADDYEFTDKPLFE